jgi:acetyl esterase
MARDADAEALVAQIRATGAPSMAERGVTAARAYLDERAVAADPGPEVELVSDERIEVDGRSIPVRLYRREAGSEMPVVVYLHGGGWVLGSIDASDAFCRRLAAAARCVLISVGYRLAPEHPFPAGLDDAVAAISWASAEATRLGGDPRRLVALGDSAGGNLVAAAVKRLVAQDRPLVSRQILAYPGTSADRIEATEHGGAWPLTDDDRRWYLEQYLAGEERSSDPDVAPLLADPAGMPATTIVLGGCDPTFAEGLAYASRLWDAAVPVDLHVFAGQIHGFLTFDPTILATADEAVGLVANAIRRSQP